MFCADKNPIFQAMLAIMLVSGAAAARADPAEPWLKGLASLVVPGAGQASNGDYGDAALHFGVFAVSVYGVIRYQNKSDYLDADERYDEDNNREFINKTTLRYDYAARLATDMALYSGYAAYRDARARDNSGFRTPAPRESLTDLAVAPFSINYLSRPTTFIPLAIQALALYHYKNSTDAYGIYRANDVSERDLHVFNLAANEMTAVGEEAFFRGFLNNEFSSLYGNNAGLVTSSAIFGLAHTGQGQTANVLEATLAGAYLGWVHQKNGFEVGEGVALHYWINVLAGISAIHNGGSAELLHIQLPF
jgi:hypothetical protein